jgi:hypothetical protein
MREIEWKVHTVLFLLFCVWGFFFEWFLGFFWSVVGSSPWIYPNSLLRYTSWKTAPLWGLGGLTTLQLTKAVRRREKQPLAYVAVLLSLSIVWITTLALLT